MAWHIDLRNEKLVKKKKRMFEQCLNNVGSRSPGSQKNVIRLCHDLYRCTSLSQLWAARRPALAGHVSLRLSTKRICCTLRVEKREVAHPWRSRNQESYRRSFTSYISIGDEASTPSLVGLPSTSTACCGLLVAKGNATMKQQGCFQHEQCVRL